jgi:hypothetical protein
LLPDKNDLGRHRPCSQNRLSRISKEVTGLAFLGCNSKRLDTPCFGKILRCVLAGPMCHDCALSAGAVFLP